MTLSSFSQSAMVSGSFEEAGRVRSHRFTPDRFGLALFATLVLLGGCERGGLSYTEGFADHEVTVMSERSVRIGTEVFVLAGVDLPNLRRRRGAGRRRCWPEKLAWPWTAWSGVPNAYTRSKSGD
jgi:hypothetical protein